MLSVWEVLIGNLAVVALIVSLWMHLSYRLHRLSVVFSQACIGGAFGLAAIGSMLLSVELETGVYFDLRLALVEAAAVFGGPISLLVTATMAISFRALTGGQGAIAGVSAIAFVSLAGLTIWRLNGRQPLEGLWPVLCAGAVASTLSLTALLVLSPIPLGHVMTELVFPVASLHLVAVLAIGMSLRYFRRFTMERDILYAALTQAPDYHFVKDADHRFVVTNHNVAHHHGRDRPSQMIGLRDFDLTTPERAQQLQEQERRVMETGSAIEHFEECIVGPDEETRWYSTSKVPLRNRHGEFVGLAGVTVDITEKKQLEHDLQTSRDVLARAMREMSDGLARFDADGDLIFCNDQFHLLLPHLSRLQQTMVDNADVMHLFVRNGERHEPPSGASGEDVEAAADVFHADTNQVIPLRDGRWLSFRTRLANDGSVLALVSDVTAMKQAEQSLLQFADKMKILAQTDSLTGLANRRSFDEALEREFVHAVNADLPLSLLLIDVDRFKRFNDTYGHLEGDRCLARVAECIAGVAKRSGDHPARFGGEEFAVLLPHTSAQTAVGLADRLRESIRSLDIAHLGNESGIVTVSIGVSVLSPDARISRALDLVSAADTALYQCKNSGRDRTMLATHSIDGLGAEQQAVA